MNIQTVAMIASSVGIILTVLNIWDKFTTARQRVKTDGMKEAKREVTFESDISAIRLGNTSIMIQLDKVDTKMDNYHERLTRVEESASQAHKRIDRLDSLEGKK